MKFGEALYWICGATMIWCLSLGITYLIPENSIPWYAWLVVLGLGFLSGSIAYGFALWVNRR